MISANQMKSGRDLPHKPTTLRFWMLNFQHYAFCSHSTAYKSSVKYYSISIKLYNYYKSIEHNSFYISNLKHETQLLHHPYKVFHFVPEPAHGNKKEHKHDNINNNKKYNDPKTYSF